MADPSVLPAAPPRDGAAAGVVGLIVDDEPQIRRVVKRALEGEVGRLLEAGTGGEGIDLVARTLRRGEQPIHLTPIEWELLRTFVLQAGRTLTHRQLFNAVWGRAYGDPQQYLRVHVANLRRKIEEDAVRPRLIITEPGVGYRLEMPR